jgi:integrase
LARVEPQTQKRAAGATETTIKPKPTPEEIKGKLVEYAWYMKKQGYAETTIRPRVRIIKRLAKLGANLYDPESVKEVIAKQDWDDGTKSNACDAYTTWLHMHGGKWSRPNYKRVSKLPFIPQESEIDQLIAACSPRMACFLQLLKETGMRPGEAWQLSWIDVDMATRTVRVTPEKGSNPRIFHISPKLAAMLENLPKIYGERVFSTPDMKLRHHQNHFAQQRKRIARKVKNPRLLRITFKTFRHWKGTMEYHRTKDIIHVQKILGHKNIKNTMVYITLAEELFKDQQEYITKVARNVKEACALVEAGFEYVTGEYNDGGKIFRKPKYY